MKTPFVETDIQQLLALCLLKYMQHPTPVTKFSMANNTMDGHSTHLSNEAFLDVTAIYSTIVREELFFLMEVTWNQLR